MTAPAAPLSLQGAAGPRWLIPAALAAVYVVWGSTYLAMRVAVEGLPPFFMASTRFLLAGAILLVVLRLRGAPAPTRREWLYSAPVGILMFLMGNGLVAVAEQHLSSGVAAVVTGTMPLWAAALGPLAGERPTARELGALALGFLGVVVLASGAEVAAEPLRAGLLLVAPVSWAVGSLLARRLPLPGGLMSAATQMLCGGAAMGVVSVLLGERPPAHPPLASLLAWAYLVSFGSLVAFSAYTYLLRHTRPAVATSYSYVNPVVAVGFGAALGGETIGLHTALAVVLIVAATALVMLGRSR